jgi:hypothetical protein
MPLPGAFIRDVTVIDRSDPYPVSMAFIPIDVIPLALGALELRCHTALFEPDSAYRGIQLLREAQLSIIVGNTPIDRIYRLIDASVNGTIYTDDPDDGILPVIPIVPEIVPAIGSLADNIAQIPRISRMLNNALNGEVYIGEFERTDDIRTLLQAIIDASTADDADIETIVSGLETVLLLLG